MSPNSHERHWEMRSIYRVPTHITDLNHKAYQPQVVSFGPYHHNDVQLRPMEEHKDRALNQFLKRSGKPHEEFLKSMREVGRDLEESYDTLDQIWKDGTGVPFLELMIKDGCFMLEIMRNTVEVGENDYAPHDPIFSNHRLLDIWPFIRRDMLMLENQLPMLVLERLITVERDGRECEGYIHELILKYLDLDPSVGGTDIFLHVMDICRKGLLTPEKKVPYGPEANDEPEAGRDMIFRSATKLNQAGIRFKKSKTTSLTDISFDSGVLRLPAITVDDATKFMFLNIMTFERLHIGTGTEVTSYTSFMDCIINDKRDVELLQNQGIIRHLMGSDQEVADLFNSMCKEVTLPLNRSLGAVQKKVSRYCKRRCNRWRAYLNHTYFRNPWTILSLIAAIFLFVLTIIQTVYTMLGDN